MYHIVAFRPLNSRKLVNAIVSDNINVGDKVTLVDLMNPNDFHELMMNGYTGRIGTRNKECHWKYYKFICIIS